MTGFNVQGEPRNCILFSPTSDISLTELNTENSYKPLYDAYNEKRQKVSPAKEAEYTTMVDFAKTMHERYHKLAEALTQSKHSQHVHFHFTTGKVKGDAKKKLDEALVKLGNEDLTLTVVFIHIGEHAKKWEKYTKHRHAGSPKTPARHCINLSFNWEEDGSKTMMEIMREIYWRISSRRSYNAA